MPGAAVFAAASDVGGGEHAAHLEPCGVNRREGRLHREVEAAVTAQTHGSAPVARHVFAMDDEHRNARAVARLVPDLIRHVRRCIEPDGYFYASRGPNAPHYIYDKMLWGLLDAHAYCGNDDALAHLERITDWAVGHLDRSRKVNDTASLPQAPRTPLMTPPPDV